MSDYLIVDEPKISKFNYLIFSPLIIIFAGIIVPIFIELPYYGRIWMPALWLALNGFFLGSSTRVKEMILAIVAVLSWFLIVFGAADFFLLFSNLETFKKAIPYIRIFSQAIFFFFLLYIVGLQSTAYSMYEYLNKRN
jgi:hypothetical protein